MQATWGSIQFSRRSQETITARREVEPLLRAIRNEISVDDENPLSQLWRADSLEQSRPTTSSNLKEFIIGKNTNTFLKKKREMDKKAKAEAKRERREEKKKRASEQSTEIPNTSKKDETD